MKKDISRLFLPIINNLLLLIVAYIICRLLFWWENRSLFTGLSAAEVWGIVHGGWRFDLAAISYTNVLYLLMVVFPCHFKESKEWQLASRILFVVINWICLISNLIDAVYFPFAQRRTTASVFTEFAGDNLTGIFAVEIVRHWYFTLIGLLLLLGLWYAYRTPILRPQKRLRYYLLSTTAFLIGGVSVFFGIRGYLDIEMRPINNSNAKNFISNPNNSALVLNTPFSIIRTMGKQSYPNLNYFEEEQLPSIFTPEKQMVCPAKEHKDNIVILLLESFSAEYSKRLTPSLPGDSYMPFLDSLMAEGLTYDLSLSNGIKSIDAQVSVFASIPMLVESFMTAQAAMNKVDGLGNYLKPLGYETAYFHGADNGSLGIEAFVRTCGIDKYFGRNEYANDADYDGRWGIWDEPFLQFVARKLGGLHEPFCASVFTLTSHHPFKIPEVYRDTFPEGPLQIHKCIRYTDHSLRRFFDYAKKQPWYANTLFVLTGDHTNMRYLPESLNSLGNFKVPIFFFHPTDTTWNGHRKGIIQQIDIMPTILHHAGFQGPYFAFGNDLLDKHDSPNGSIAYLNDQYQFIEPDWLLQFDGERTTALFYYPLDPLLQANLATDPKAAEQRKKMERKLKAIIQQYMYRMNHNRLTVLTTSAVTQEPQQ